ncbi:hypothetical protein IHQ68_10310 [Chelatococcus sambhunathii]|uniref:DUF748 domain-containing protein n=1 Tax=Chelatococcus sambhunathii TaxID=363953 RepID=A0ABU1DG33_9HYPH|nr:hypothetical protein [Chelatococcus sambhunathii]MDR4307011.1 hypothetical protein [Chelatococcus sambhunathii]
MNRKTAGILGALVICAATLAFATPYAVRKFAEAEVDRSLSRIAWQTTSLVRRGDVTVDVWSWTVNVASIEIIGAGGETRTEIGRLTIVRPSGSDGRMTARRMILDDVKAAGPSETMTIPRAEIRGYAGPERGLTATPGLNRGAKSQADLFENLSIDRLVAPVVTFTAKSGIRRSVRNLVVSGMQDGVIGSATADAITLTAPYLPRTDPDAPSSLLISTGAVRYEQLSLPTLWRFRDGVKDEERRSLLKSASIADLNVSLTMRPGGRFSASADRLDVDDVALSPLGFELSAFDPIATGMRFGSDATPNEVREQLSFTASLLRAASFRKVAVTNARAQISSAGEPQTTFNLGSVQVGPYADARLDTVKFAKAAYEEAGAMKATLDAGGAYGFDASGVLAYVERVARNEVLLTTTPTASEMLKIIPRVKALDAQALDVWTPDGSLKADRARIDLDAPLDAVPQNVMVRLDGLDASPPADSAAQKWIERMELDGLKGSAKFSVTLDPDKNALKLDWLDYSFEGLGAIEASGSFADVDPVLAVASGADFVDKFSAIKLAPFKLTLKDGGAADVLLRRAAAKAGEPPESFRESFARELQETIPALLGPPAEQSGVAAADFIRDPRSAEITLAPRKTDQTLLDLIRAAQLGPVGLAQVVDLQVLYKR